ncbi:MAG: PocR ligand-binding domain-containing protein [Caldilineaceae bacterium]
MTVSSPSASAAPAAHTTPFYTTRELQGLLNVDRTTIYRMAESGRLPAVKVGSQWRFPRRTVDQWLATHAGYVPASAPAPEAPTAPAAPVLPADDWQRELPIDCLQILQETFAEALGAMVLMTDLEGRPITQPSNACGLVQAIQSNPYAHARCLQWWAELGRRPSMHPSFIPSELGLLCTRGFFRRGNELVGMVIVGGIAPQSWPPAPGELARIATWLGVETTLLQPHLHEVFHVDTAQEQRLLAVVQRLADVVTHILNERARMLDA